MTIARSSYPSYIAYDTGSTGAATISGTGSAWTNSNALYIGHLGSGTLNVEAGGRLAVAGASYLGQRSSSTGAVRVSGPGSAWTNTGSIRVGSSGSGTLAIDGGGQVTSQQGYLGSLPGSMGTVTVSESGSAWTNSLQLFVGDQGIGMLTVEAGGRVSNSDGYIGGASATPSTVTVTGAESKWTNTGRLYIRSSAPAPLTVTEGGTVSANTIYAAMTDLHGNGTITANGAVMDTDLSLDSLHSASPTLVFGSGGTLKLTLDGTGALGAGYRGTGSLRIADGVAVASTIGVLGENAGSYGSATVSGVGSKWTNSGELYIGNSGRGSLTVADGAQVTARSLYASLSDLHGDGTVTVSAGAVLDADLVFDASHGTTQSLPFGSGGALNLTIAGSTLGLGYKGRGTLRIADGVVVTSARGELGYYSGSTGKATVSGAGSKWTKSLSHKSLHAATR